jgi:cytochrome c biogenesis protein
MLRLPESREFMSDAEPDTVLDGAEQWLRQHRWRVRRGETAADGSRWVAAEKGYSRETGNLVFHLSLIFILVGVAVGGLLGWKGNVIVREGSGFSNTLTQYDAWGGGRFVDPNALDPFSFTLDDFRVDFERGEAQRGAPRLFEADVTYRSSPTADPERVIIEVNSPMTASGAKVFLVGHGYAPQIVVRDSTGDVVFDDTVVFLPQDGNFTSTGVVKVPDATPSLGFNGLFLATAAITEELGPHSTFPAPDYPAVFLAAFTGDLGMDDGRPQSVYTLDTSRMEQIGLESLIPGDVWELPDGAGSIELVGYERWASFQIAHDPGKELALLASIVAMLGLMLSLFVRRRRVWVKVAPAVEPGAGPPGTLVQVAALAKSESADLGADVSALTEHLGGPPADERSEP